jgi:hypothetical protein
MEKREGKEQREEKEQKEEREEKEQSERCEASRHNLRTRVMTEAGAWAGCVIAIKMS